MVGSGVNHKGFLGWLCWGFWFGALGGGVAVHIVAVQDRAGSVVHCWRIVEVLLTLRATRLYTAPAKLALLPSLGLAVPQTP